MKYIKLYEDIDWEDWNEEEGINKFIFDLDNNIYPPFKDIKINDRVEFIVNNKSYFATIIKLLYRNTISICLTFEFDNFINGHGANNKGKLGHCWNIDNKSLIFRRDINGLIQRLRQI